ncbi:alpha/beta hydrolase [Chryseobacterium sp. MYb264]|uniref:alpha/beta hydrolase n=1 Tax=Chryseobacterium sp. MYb264 TaxID=2745153 RepID=UPI002E13C090|nr:alpha/beta hydrolase [Chryseobacterium sp. MYb264]
MKTFLIPALLFLFPPFLVPAQVKNEEVKLWPSVLPDQGGSRGPEIRNEKGSITQVSEPRMIVYRPAQPNGTAILVISGGGYAHIESGKEGTPASRRLQKEGITAFELIYRLPGEGWKSKTVPFEDAQRALRIIRHDAQKYNIDPDKIGVLGFSAGGHLAGISSSLYEVPFYSPVDAKDSVSSRPDFSGLIYPVISMLPPNNKTQSRKKIIGESPSEADEVRFSVDKQVNTGTPPTFLAQAADDPISPVDNSFLMAAALRNLQLPVEIHIYQTGGHGWGVGKSGSPVSSWFDLFTTWIKSNGYLEKQKRNP